MALVKKGLFFMAFYGHQISIIISYHFYDNDNDKDNDNDNENLLFSHQT